MQFTSYKYIFQSPKHTKYLSSLTFPSLNTYVLCIPLPLPLHNFYIYICSLLISLKTIKHSICDGNFFSYPYMFVLISTIKDTSLSLSLILISL